MSGMSSLFNQMRASREASMNEGTQQEENKDKETLNEGTQQEENKESDKDKEENQNEEQNVDEEVSAVFCSECGALVSGYMNESEVDECPCCGSEELVEKVVKVVRDGKVVSKKVPTKKKRLSSAQKAALAKARKKAHSASANKQRAKSIKKRSKAGLNEDDDYVCTECGYSGDYEDFSTDDEGNMICPECGAVVDESCKGKKSVKEEKQNEEKDDKSDLKALLESVNAPEFMHKALEEGKTDLVTGYLNMKMGSKE